MSLDKTLGFALALVAFIHALNSPPVSSMDAEHALVFFVTLYICNTCAARLYMGK
jgi:hypothetical protein